MHDDMQPDQLGQGAPQGTDREGAMARADLYKLANYSLKLFKKMGDEDQLEGWVQAKITKAADYIASVYHYLEYEMKVNEYGEHLATADVMSEGKRGELTNKLMEAKSKLSELKKLQADKISGKQVSEGVERPCQECGGTGMVTVQPSEATKGKIQKYKRLTKAMHAAHKRIDANKNGIPDEDEMEEGFEANAKTGDTFKTKTGVATKTDTGLKHERPASSYDDGGDELDSIAKSGKGIKSHAKAKSAAEKKAEAPKLKKSKTGTWGMENGEKFDNRKKEKAVDETIGQGVYAEGKKAKKDYDGDGKLESGKDEHAGSVDKAIKKAKAEKKVSETTAWKKKAAALKESLAAMSETVSDQNIEQLIELAAKQDPQGLASAKQGGPEAVMEFLTKFAAGQSTMTQTAPAQGGVAATNGDPDGEWHDFDLDPQQQAQNTLQPGMNVPDQWRGVNENADFTRMKQFLTRLNG